MIKAKQAAKTAAVTKVTAINKQFEILRSAARLAIDAKAQEDAAKAGKGNATEMLVASLTGSAIWNLKLTFDVKDRNGDIVEHCKGIAISEYAKGFTLDGKEYRAKTSAFRAAVLLRLFDMKDDKGSQCETVWKVFVSAHKVAEQLRNNAILASLDASGRLKLAGGKGKEAAALKEAANKSVTSLVNAAKGGAAKKGTNSTPQNDNTKGAIDLDGALRTVAAYASLVKDGKEAPSSARLSYLRKIVADAAKALAEHGDD